MVRNYDSAVAASVTNPVQLMRAGAGCCSCAAASDKFALEGDYRPTNTIFNNLGKCNENN